MCLISLFPVRRSVRMCPVRPNGIRTGFGRPCKRVVFDHSVSRSQERSIPGCASGRPPCVRPDGLYCFALPCLQRLYICIFLKGKMTYVFERLRSVFEKQFSACSPSKYRSKPSFEIAQTKFKQLWVICEEEAWAEKLVLSTDWEEDRCSTKFEIVRRIEELRGWSNGGLHWRRERV